MRRICALIAILQIIISVLFHPYDAFAQSDTSRRLVLVANAHSGITALTPAEVRKLFLGITIEQNGHSLIALRNQTDQVLHEVFLQKVMFMSGPMYERTLLTRLLRTKGPRPGAYSSEQELHVALQANPNTVTYMWSDQAEATPDLRVISELWRE